MLRADLKEDTFAIGAVLFLATSILFIGTTVSHLLVERELLDHAKTQTVRWTKYLEMHPGEINNHFLDAQLGREISEAPESLKFMSDIFRFELYDHKGESRFISGYAEWITRASPQFKLVTDLIKSQKKIREPQVYLFSGENDQLPSRYGLVIVPFNLKGEEIGYVAAYVDQSAEYNALSEILNFIAFLTVILMLIGGGIPTLIAIHKINEKRKADDRIHFLSHYDSLSQLPNRDSFNRRLTESLSRNRKVDGQIAIVCLDVDRFKEVNDTLGHSTGDAVIASLAERLKEVTRESDLLARLSGDEFAIALFGVQNCEEITEFVRRLRCRIAKPFEVKDQQISCTVSIGISIAPVDGQIAADLLKCADLALYRAKNDGRNTVRFFERQMDAALQRRRSTEHELRQALHLGQFEVFYQPQFDLSTGKICGNEALIRWHHPVHGTIAPGHFIAIAEETGLIGPIGEWTLKQACTTAKSWKYPYKVAVNLSPVQFQTCSVSRLVQDALEGSGLEANRLELEITETILMSDTKKVLKELNRIRQLGVSIAMDDFGTGYSSLSYLSKFAFDKIKIDRSFIQSIERDETVAAIVDTIVGLGRSLGVTITAEGVETDAQAEILKRFGCNQVQGFLYGYPISTKDHAKFIAESSSYHSAEVEGEARVA